MLSTLTMGTRTRTKASVKESELEDNNTHISLSNPLSRARAQTASPEENFFSVTIDDGTSSVAFCASRQMSKSSPSAPGLEVGKTYDCILKLRQNCEEKRWFAETLIPIDNPIDEHLRWFQLGHHDKSLSQLPSSRFHHSNLCHKFGYPTRRRNSVEAYRLICVNSRLQQQMQQRKKQVPIRSRNLQSKRTYSKLTTTTPSLRPLHNPRGLQTTRLNRNGNKIRNENAKRRVTLSPATIRASKPTPTPVQPNPLEGLVLKDLTTVLQKSERDVQEMIEELQLEGKIYQNERGGYLPL